MQTWPQVAEMSSVFRYAKESGTAFRPTSQASTEVVLERLRQADYKLTDREDKPTRSRPSAPFITSTLQQAASTRLGFSVKKTMMMAQRLYEAGHITYMRTDSTNLSQEAVENAREFIDDQFGSRYLPEKPNSYSSKEGAQEAHEAIRPSSVTAQPGSISGLERDAERLYELIWKQFVACQMTPAEYLSTTLTVRIGDFDLKAKGRTLKFDGYTRVMAGLAKKGEDIILPALEKGDPLDLKKD